MDAGGGGAAAGGGEAAAAGGDGARAATGAIRAVAKVHLALGWAAATFALCAVTLQPQLKPQGGQCAATEVDAATMRAKGLLLLLPAGAQAAATTVAAFAPDAWRWRRLHVGWTFAAFAHVLSVFTYFHLEDAFTAAAAVAFSGCPGHMYVETAMFIAHNVLLFVPLCVFFIVGIAALVAAVVAL